MAWGLVLWTTNTAVKCHDEVARGIQMSMARCTGCSIVAGPKKQPSLKSILSSDYTGFVCFRRREHYSS
jgi:hypothetical protein